MLEHGTKPDVIAHEKPPSRGRILSPRTACAHMGGRPSESTLAKMRMRGDGPPFVKLGARLIGYYEHDLDAWAASRRRQSTSERS